MDNFLYNYWKLFLLFTMILDFGGLQSLFILKIQKNRLSKIDVLLMPIFLLFTRYIYTVQTFQ